MSFKEYNQDQLFLLPPSLHEFLPQGHLACVINEVVNELDLRERCDRYSDLGCPAYHPQMLLKVLFCGYAMGERSSPLLAHRMRISSTWRRETSRGIFQIRGWRAFVRGLASILNFREVGLDMMKVRIVIFAHWERFFPTRDY